MQTEPQLAKRTNFLKSSPTLKMGAIAQELKNQGYPVINLTVGEPDYPSFLEARKGGIEAIEKGLTRYTSASGRLDLREKVALFLTKELNHPVTSKEVIIGSGAKFLIYASLQLILDPGDEVLIPVPYWVSYPVMVELSGGVPKFVPTNIEHNFNPIPSDLSQYVTQKTKALILCSPSNPTGSALTKDELKNLANWLYQYPHIWIISDDIYNRLYFGQERLAPHLLHVAPELSSRTICIGGASKTFSMTGWRIGWLKATENFAQKIGDYASQTTSNPSSISQNALFKVLDDYQSPLEKEIQILIDKKNYVEYEFQQLQIPYVKPQGAFYFFFNGKILIEKLNHQFNTQINSSHELSEILLKKFYIAMVPGSEFGMEYWMRMSFAVKKEDLIETFSRLKKLF